MPTTIAFADCLEFGRKSKVKSVGSYEENNSIHCHVHD
uniref:Uncharacterized protein n=1 Tax=Arundo donax TaxID=35708 RepID=A0A0A8Y6I0_ARUDO